VPCRHAHASDALPPRARSSTAFFGARWQSERAHDPSGSVVEVVVAAGLVVVLAATVVVGVGSAWYTLPKITEALAESGGQLPLLTRMIVSLGTFLAHQGIWAVPLFMVALIAIFYLVFIYKKTKFSWYGGSGQDVTIFQFRGIIFRSWHKCQGQLKSKLLVLAGECVKSLLN